MKKKLILLGFSVAFLFSCKKTELSDISPSPTKTVSEVTRENDVHSCVAIRTLSDRNDPSTSAVGEKAYFWPNNTTGPTVLRVKFLSGGSEYVRSKIKSYAKQWEQYANIRFDFVSDNQPADIRITNQSGDGSWSYMGTSALGLPNNEATMNYGWFNDSTEESEFSRVIVHEFGHAIGLGHEQSHPNVTIQWNKPYVYDYFQRTNGWPKDAVDQNVFYTYPASEVTYSEYDPTSIMHYPIPKEFTLNGVSVGWNTELSAIDKSFIQRVYPFPNGGGGPVVTEKILYTIIGFRAYIGNTIMTNKLEVRSNTTGDIILYEALPGYPLDYWKYDQYIIQDETGKQYKFTSQTSFIAKTTTGLKGAIKIFKNGQQIFSN